MREVGGEEREPCAEGGDEKEKGVEGESTALCNAKLGRFPAPAFPRTLESGVRPRRLRLGHRWCPRERGRAQAPAECVGPNESSRQSPPSHGKGQLEREKGSRHRRIKKFHQHTTTPMRSLEGRSTRTRSPDQTKRPSDVGAIQGAWSTEGPEKG